MESFKLDLRIMMIIVRDAKADIEPDTIVVVTAAIERADRPVMVLLCACFSGFL